MRAVEDAQRELRVGPRDDSAGERAVLLPRAEEERVVAEEQVVRFARRREPGRGSFARLAADRSLADVERRSSCACPRRPRRRRARDDQSLPRAASRAIPRCANRTSGSASSSAKNGSTKIRCRDSGEAVPLPTRVTGRRGTASRARRARAAALCRLPAREQDQAGEREQQHERARASVQPDGEVPGDVVEVLQDREGTAELRSAAADADVEAGREHACRSSRTESRARATTTNAGSASRRRRA